MKKLMRFATSLALPALVFASAAAPAAVTCEQLAEIAYVTERMRDGGAPLADIMREADRLDTDKRFSATEVADIRETMDNAFKRIRNANEAYLDCRKKEKK